CRLLLLVWQNLRQAISRGTRKASFLDVLPRHELDVLPSALPGVGRYAAAYSRLSGRLCRLELHFLDRLIYRRYLGAYLPVPGVLHTEVRQEMPEQSVGRGRNDAGMDAAFTAAVPHLRNAA